MKSNMLILIIILVPFTTIAQKPLAFNAVFNVYRRDKAAIDAYAKQFISENTGLFFNRTSSFGADKPIQSVPIELFAITDSGVIANCMFMFKSDTVRAKIGFLSKDNRTRISMVPANDYRQNWRTADMLHNEFKTVYTKYHTFLKKKTTADDITGTTW